MQKKEEGYGVHIVESGIRQGPKYAQHVVNLCDNMWIGLFTTLIFSYFLIIEIMTIYYNNPEAMNEKRSEKEIEPESRLYGTRALTLAGLTFAGIIFLIDNYEKTYEDALFILIYSFGLLLLSYNFEILTGGKEIYFVVQDRLLTYGFLGLIIALFVFFWETLIIISIILSIFIFILTIIHLREIQITLECYKAERTKTWVTFIFG